jgi:hypothetical protein
MAVEGVTASGRRILFRTNERLAPGDKVGLSADPEKIRIFTEDQQ